MFRSFQSLRHAISENLHRINGPKPMRPNKNLLTIPVASLATSFLITDTNVINLDTCAGISSYRHCSEGTLIITLSNYKCTYNIEIPEVEVPEVTGIENDIKSGSYISYEFNEKVQKGIANFLNDPQKCLGRKDLVKYLEKAIKE